MPFILRRTVCALVLLLSCLPVTGVADPVSDLPVDPIYLWAEKPLVSPDREYIKDQRVYAVDNPAMIPYWPAAEKANGTAVVIFPGGGYVRLAIDHEGYDIAKWFAERGVAAACPRTMVGGVGHARCTVAARAARRARALDRRTGLVADAVAGRAAATAGGNVGRCARRGAGAQRSDPHAQSRPRLRHGAFVFCADRCG